MSGYPARVEAALADVEAAARSGQTRAIQRALRTVYDLGIPRDLWRAAANRGRSIAQRDYLLELERKVRTRRP